MYETIVRDGITPERVAEGHEKQQLLLGKVSELIGAYRVDGDVDHLADMVEVAMTLAADQSADVTEAIVRRIDELGSFAGGHVVSVDAPHTHGGAISAQISVKAAIWRDGQLLCVKKQPNFGDQWEIAGGRLSGGDDPRETICKEILEELNILDPVVGEVIATGFADPLSGFLPMFYNLFRVTLSDDAAITLSDEHTDWGYKSRDEVEALAATGEFNPSLARMLLPLWPDDAV